MLLDRRLLTLVRFGRVWLIVSVICGAAAGLMAVVQATWLSRVVSEIFLGSATGQSLAWPLGLLLAAAVLRAALVWARQVAGSMAAAGIRRHLRRNVFDAILDGGPLAMARDQKGDVATTLIDGIESCDAYFSRYLPQVPLAVVVPLIIAISVTSVDPLSGLVLVLTAPLIPVFLSLIGKAAASRGEAQWRALRRLGASSVELIQGLGVLVRLGRAGDWVSRARKQSDELRRRAMSVIRVAMLSGFALEGVVTLSTAVVAVEVGIRLLYGRLELEQALKVLLLAPEMYLPLRLLGAHFHDGASAAAAARRAFEIIDSGTSRPGPPRVGAGKEAGNRASGSRARAAQRIVLDQVSYAYPPPRPGDGDADAAGLAPRPAIDSVSLEIEPGSIVALVGPSGSGKTTISSLLMRFIEPDSGQIRAGGAGLSTIDPSAWRRRISWVPQSPHLGRASVAESIAISRPDAARYEIERAAIAAELHDEILAFDQGYDTLVGEGALGLSGGQIQRIALARAFLRDPDLVILDEPVARLDPTLSLRLAAACRRLVRGRTALVIAHRLETVRFADRVVVLDSGRVVEQGTHTRLIETASARDGQGLYLRLVQAIGRLQ